MSDIKVLIADDAAGMRLILRKRIEKTAGFCVVGEAETGRETLSLYDRLRPDVVFLDVDMPERTGVECARMIQDRDPACILIFATAHEEYMGDAFEVYAFDYLVKPFKLERLDRTLSRVKEIRDKQRAAEMPKPAIVRNAAGRLMLKHRDGVSFLSMNDIVLIQREDRSTVLYAAGGRRYVTGETLSETGARLDPDVFFRCHKSYIINLSRIRDISPYGRWTYIVRLDGTDHDALITYEKYEELERMFS